MYCLISFFMPILALLVWFLVNLGEVQRQFINRVSEVSTVNFSGVRNIFSIITGDSSQTFLHNLYLSLHMLPLLANLLLLLVFLLWNNKDNIGQYEYCYIIQATFYISFSSSFCYGATFAILFIDFFSFNNSIDIFFYLIIIY